LRSTAAAVMLFTMGSIIAYVAALAAIFILSASPNQLAPFEPTGPWTVEVSEGVCLVGRTFGPNQQQPTLGFRKSPNAEDFEVSLWVNEPSKDGSYGTAQLTLDRLPPIEAKYSKGPVSIPGMQLIRISTEQPELDALVSTKTLAIKAGDFHAAFYLRNVKRALDALASCERDLLISWGMDPAVLATIATPHRGELARFFSTNDYPTDAIGMKKQGTAGVRFWVTTDGKVRDCKIVASAGHPLLDSKTCQVLTKRGRLEPARTKEGAAVESISFARVNWMMPTRY
jgi:TonB family protein